MGTSPPSFDIPNLLPPSIENIAKGTRMIQDCYGRCDGQRLTGLRSGMCKAGFAGDDAPRAVFRESHMGICIRQRCWTLCNSVADDHF